MLRNAIRAAISSNAVCGQHSVMRPIGTYPKTVM
jgi:hypothetical protein